MKKSRGAFANQPFRDQIRLPSRKRRSLPLREKSPPPQPSRLPTHELSEKDLFQQAMADVEPMDSGVYELPELPGALTYRSAEEEVRDELEAIVSGKVAFDMFHNDEHVEGAVQGLDPRVLRQLRAGELSWQGYLDLHGLRVEEAREALERFLLQQRRKHHRCLLIVHGRGLNSPDKEPVLKKRLLRWLTRGFLRKKVLAFSSARPYDGGSGALYLLMRK